MNRTSEIEIAHERGLVEAGALHDLIAEIAVLEDQVALLEEGLPHAPGMERAALAKEIAAYRAQLDARRQALQQERRHRGTAPMDATADATPGSSAAERD